MTKPARSVKYDFHRIPETNTFVATADGAEIGRFEGKSKFDSGAAQDAAKKCIIVHRTNAVNKENEAEEYKYQYLKPLSDNEKKWLKMHKRLYIDNVLGTQSDYDAYLRYAEIVRKSIRENPRPEQHPLANEYLQSI